ncbi:DNA primase [Selenomonadales bacterium OttesenSCG-928-I06]|nr:DNA primase [Selenomonadales bacterium OttesenSCG-928-I06]
MKTGQLGTFVEQLKSNLDIVNIISDYVALTKKGRQHWGNCPFHQENTPSFSVSLDKGFFYCFGCQTGGDIFSFIMKIENVTFFEAVKILAAKVNMPLPELERTTREKAQEEEWKKIHQACNLASDFFKACLLKTNYGKPALEYLNNRGFTEESLENFKIGFAPPTWDKLINALKSKGISVDILLKSGLAATSQSKNNVYERFRNRIMFPIFDIRDRVIGFGGRSIDNTEPKYLNSPETKIFNKRQVLYGLNIAYKYIKESGKVIIVEGYIDVITAHNLGFKNTVASLGTAFTPDQARQLLKLNNPELIFCYDSDAAGQKATLKALTVIKNMLKANVKILKLTDSKDPDEFLKKNGKEAFQELLSKPLSLLEYQIDLILAENDYSTIEGKVKLVSKLAPVLLDSNNSIEINEHITKLAQITKIDENSFRSELNKYIFYNKKDKNVKTGQDKIGFLSLRPPSIAEIEAERQLIRLMFENTEVIPHCIANLSSEEIKGSIREEIINFVFNAYNRKSDTLNQELINNLYEEDNTLSEEAKTELSQIMLMDLNTVNNPSIEQDLMRYVDGCIKSIKLAYLNNLYETHRLIADELERLGDDRFLQELSESQKIKNEINKLHRT